VHVNLEDVANRSFSAIFSAVLFIALLLSGCGSNSRQGKQTPTEEQRSESAPGSVAAPAAPDRRPVIVAFGDSLTAGVVENTYPEYLQGILDANGYAYRVENQGVSGDTTTDGLARIDNVLAEHPALVILEFGGNDGLRGIPVDATRQNLAQIIARLKAANIPTVLLGITLPPNYGSDYVKPFTAMFPELAKQYKLRLFPFLLIDVYQHPDMMQPDGIHPNGEGNKIVARDVFRFIQPMLHKP
jgi:acyl-CoA thioesterase-1